MDIKIALIGVGILLIFVVPLVWVHIKGKKEEKIIVNKLHELANQNATRLIEYDIWGNFAIAIDDKKKLYYIQNKPFSIQQFNLDEIKKCSVINSGRVVDKIEEQLHHVNRLELLLTNGYFEEEARILFYDANISMQIEQEILLIKKWQSIISNHLQ